VPDVDDSASTSPDSRLHDVLLHYLESAEQGVPPDPAEFIACHPEFASELQEFLEIQGRVERVAAPVRQVSQEFLRASRSGERPWSVSAPASPPLGPQRSGRQLNPDRPRFSDELARVLRSRLLAGTFIGTVAFAVMVLVGLASPRGRYDHLSLALYGSMAVWYGALLMRLVRHRDLSLSGLRFVEVLALAAYAAHSAWKDVQHYSRYWSSFEVSEQWFLVSHSCLNWVFLILIYAVLIPNDWRRSLRVLAGMACIPLAVYGVTWLSFDESRRSAAPLFDLFAMARVMAAAVAINVFGAHKIISLRREAYEARHLGNYRVVRRLSAGGMGEVYLAEHRSLNRPYAIKLIHPELAADQTNRKRFEREIRAVARLTHWNTIEIIDYGHAPDGTFYYVMEYVEGLNLRELVDRYGPVNPGRVVYLLRQVCAALAEAHAAGLVHRDIKPGNVMLTELAGLADVVKVLDFGLVQNVVPSEDDDTLTRTGMAVGTPGYIAPEQAAGEAEVRSDIYSTGAVGYFLLAGQKPLGGRRTPQEKESYTQEPAPLRQLRHEIPADLEAVIERCLRPNPEERFADVLLLDQALAACDCSASWGPEDAAAWWRASRASPNQAALRTAVSPQHNEATGT
jgi:serine/threonine-protein kinase